MSSLAARCAVELWLASGPRTAERLQALADHFAAQYGLDPAVIGIEARQAVPRGMLPMPISQ